LYYHSQDFWQVAKGKRPSWGWQSILVGQESIEDKIQWSVGDRQIIKIQEDRWLAKGVIGGPAPRGEPEKVVDFIVPDQNARNTSLLC